MENKLNYEVLELSRTELQELNGGWNLVEYVAYGLGVVEGTIDNFFSGATDPGYGDGSSSGFYNNSGGLKY